jgi:hypothetical protein
MNANLKIGVISLAVLFVGGGLGACTSTAASTGAGGSGGEGATTGAAGSTGVGGNSSGIVCNASNGNFAPGPEVTCPAPPASGLITNFSVPADAGVPDGGATQARFGDDSTTLSGGESVYANSPGTITSDVSGGDWHIVANVANYAGFSLYFDDVSVNGMLCNMVDASKFTGISFDISGTTSNQPITMGIGIADDTPPPTWFTSVGATIGSTPVPAGSCIPAAGGTQYYHPGCNDPTSPAINVSSATKTVKFVWTDFVNGQCKANVEPDQIVSIYWQFAWSSTATPYTADIHIDNLTFTTN